VVVNNVLRPVTLVALQNYRALVVNPVEWRKEAESVIASAEIEDVRIALYARLEERYGIRNGVFPVAKGEINFLTEPLHNLGVGAAEAQRLAALKYLGSLHGQLSWAGQYFKERLNVVYRDSRHLTEFVDKLLTATLRSAPGRKPPGKWIPENIFLEVVPRTPDFRPGRVTAQGSKD
jgi:hypothetical protein